MGERQCSVCIEEVAIGAQTLITSCHHIMHEVCGRYLFRQTGMSCPACRTPQAKYEDISCARCRPILARTHDPNPEVKTVLPLDCLHIHKKNCLDDHDQDYGRVHQRHLMDNPRPGPSCYQCGDPGPPTIRPRTTARDADNRRVHTISISSEGD